MKILVLGGTAFIGRHFVEAARARGHELTLFHRGRTNPDAFPEVESIHGDRDGGLDGLGARTWDAVVDTSGYLPRVVRQSAKALRERVGHYTFISTISVYPDVSKPIDENSPVGRLEDPTTEELNNETYGPLKALCEQAVQDELGDRALVLRPGLIVGPFDPTNRFTYWPARVARGGKVLIFGPASRVVQFIDARDLMEFNLRLIERGHGDVINCTGYHPPVTISDVFEACGEARDHVAGFETNPPAQPVWVDDAFLEAAEVQPWMELPLWVPDTPSDRGFYDTSTERARATGLTYRPLTETARDTLAWVSKFPEDQRPGSDRAGLDPEKEEELLARWNAASRG